MIFPSVIILFFLFSMESLLGNDGLENFAIPTSTVVTNDQLVSNSALKNLAVFKYDAHKPFFRILIFSACICAYVTQIEDSKAEVCISD